MAAAFGPWKPAAAAVGEASSEPVGAHWAESPRQLLQVFGDANRCEMPSGPTAGENVAWAVTGATADGENSYEVAAVAVAAFVVAAVAVAAFAVAVVAAAAFAAVS